MRLIMTIQQKTKSKGRIIEFERRNPTDQVENFKLPESTINRKHLKRVLDMYMYDHLTKDEYEDHLNLYLAFDFDTIELINTKRDL